MFVNLNDITLPITVSSTPTAYPIPSAALNCNLQFCYGE